MCEKEGVNNNFTEVGGTTKKGGKSKMFSQCLKTVVRNFGG